MKIDYHFDNGLGVDVGYGNDKEMVELNSVFEDVAIVYSFDYHYHTNGYLSRIVPFCYEN